MDWPAKIQGNIYIYGNILKSAEKKTMRMIQMFSVYTNVKYWTHSSADESTTIFQPGARVEQDTKGACSW